MYNRLKVTIVMELKSFVLFVIVFSTVLKCVQSVMIRSIRNRIGAYVFNNVFYPLPTTNKNFMANFTLTDRDL